MFDAGTCMPKVIEMVGWSEPAFAHEAALQCITKCITGGNEQENQAMVQTLKTDAHFQVRCFVSIGRTLIHKCL